MFFFFSAVSLRILCMCVGHIFNISSAKKSTLKHNTYWTCWI